jgi:hypothetical protein
MKQKNGNRREDKIRRNEIENEIEEIDKKR